MHGTALRTLKHAIVHVAPEPKLAQIPLRRVEERLIRAASGTFSVIERLECGHELTIQPEADPLTAKYRRCKQCEVAALRPRVLPSRCGNRGWWRNPAPEPLLQGLTESLDDYEFRITSSMLRLIVRDSEETADESTDEHTPTLKSAIAYLHGEAQLASSEDEHEDFSISLQLLGLLHDGWSGGPGIFDVACGYAVNLPHARYLRRRAARAAFLHQQFLRLIPDYDASTEIVPDDDPTDGRKRFYGNRFTTGVCDLGDEASPEHDPTSTRGTAEDDTAADRRPRNWPDANPRYPSETRARAADRPGLPNNSRGRAPLRISSPAQRRASRKAGLAYSALRAARSAQTYSGA